MTSSETNIAAFDEFFDRKEIQRLQDEFSTATGVASVITQRDGTPITVGSNFTRLYTEIIHKTKKGCANCSTLDTELGRQDRVEPIIQPGLGGGLWDAGVSIKVGNQHVANWLIGQVRHETHVDAIIRAYAHEFGSNESDFMEAFHDVPIMSRPQFECVAQLLLSFVTQLSTAAYLRVQQAHLIADEKKTRADLTRLSTAIEQSSATIVITDVEGTIQYVNPAFGEITGYTVGEALGQNPRVLKSGKQDADFYRELWAIISNGATWKGQLVNKRKDGTFYTEEATISPVLDETGRIVNYVAVKRDITEHLALTAQFEQAQKMESVGRLAGGVAHDFNNMLQAIVGHAEMAQEEANPTTSIFTNLQEVLKAAGHSANLVRQLLTFARKQPVSPQIIDLNETVEGMLKMLRRLIGEAIEFLWNPDRSLPPVKIDPSQIDQLLTNLCINAQDAIDDVGTITIVTETATIDEASCASHAGSLPGQYVVLSVRDTGCGMNRETMNHLFEPFFTTKEVGKGTGLGLATVYGVVKQNNGFIDVQSELGKGTTFKIFLPQQAPLVDPLTEATQIKPMELGTETILLVEDESMILDLTTTILRRLGYTVLPVDSPDEAIHCVREYIDPIDLLMTDIVMPEMNGRDLASTLQSQKPDLKCLFMSGYTADIISRNGTLDEGVHFIQKPFSTQELATKVREALR